MRQRELKSMTNHDSAALTDRPLQRRAATTRGLDDAAAVRTAAARGTASMTGPATASRLADVAVIAIGRNEGERLRRCLESVAGRGAAGGVRRLRLDR